MEYVPPVRTPWKDFAAPLGCVPGNTETVTVVRSPGRAPAVPAKRGRGVLMSVTVSSETTGLVVSTVNVRELLVPLLPAPSCWRTRAVQVPSASFGGVTVNEPFAATGTESEYAGVPLVVEPANRSTVTVPASPPSAPPVPVSVDGLSLSALRVTVGAVESEYTSVSDAGPDGHTLPLTLETALVLM
jgi:hypothetical protein